MSFEEAFSPNMKLTPVFPYKLKLAIRSITHVFFFFFKEYGPYLALSTKREKCDTLMSAL